MWDLEACRRGTGLAAVIAERLDVEAAPSLPCGVALGIPADRSTETLRRWIEAALTKGYRRVKIKVAPGMGYGAGIGSGVCAGRLRTPAHGGREWCL